MTEVQSVRWRHQHQDAPIEALERHFPRTVLWYWHRRGSGGVVDHRAAGLATLGPRRRGDGATGENWLLPQGNESRAERLPDKCTVKMKAGNVLRMLTPGGGGWGDPDWSGSGGIDTWLPFGDVGQRLVDGLDELWASMFELLSGLSADEWSRPTPCAEWDVRQLAAHIAGGQSPSEGMPQPEPPAGWTTDKQGVDEMTAYGVAARDDWSPPQIIDELTAATTAQVDRLRQLDEAGWGAPADWPPGDPTMRGYAKNRLLDAYIHLLDLRVALDRPLDLEAEPTAFELCVEQAFEFSGWGAVKKAGITDDCRIRIDLDDRDGITDLVVEDRRGRLEEPDGEPTDRLTGSRAAFLFASVDRREWWDIVGRLEADGEAARRLADDYVIWL